MAGLSGWHLLILLAVVVLLFGAKRLPDMARAVGQSARIFKGEMKDAAAEEPARNEHHAPAALDESPSPVAPVRQPTSDTTYPPTG